MAAGEIRAFTEEGNINPEWTQFINNRDPLTSEIAAHYLSGSKLRKETRCLMQECVMPSRTCSFTDSSTKTEFFNPMMLCFFCDRTFHTGCLDLDSNLIREESVPWRCCDCKKSLLNSHCQDYYKKTSYKLNLINRRTRFLNKTLIPEKESSFKGEIEFDLEDLASFERRAIAIMKEEDPDTVLDVTTVTPTLVKQVMKARNDKKRSMEAAERFRMEMERKERELKSLREQIERTCISSDSSRSLYATMNANDSIAHDSSQIGPSFRGIEHSSMLYPSTGSNRASNLLNTFYTGRDSSANIERNNFV